VGSAVVGGGASTGDFLGDRVKLADLRQSMCLDAWNALALAELEEEWLWARRCAAKTLRDPAFGHKENVKDSADLGLAAAYGAQFGTSVARLIVEAVDEASGAAVGAASAAEIAAPAAARIFGVAGAILATGIAIHGWANTKALQVNVRKLLDDLTDSLQCSQRWLATVGKLDCILCHSALQLSDKSSCCTNLWHCFHSKCYKRWARPRYNAGQEFGCPSCGGAMAPKRRPLWEELANKVGEPSSAICD